MVELHERLTTGNPYTGMWRMELFDDRLCPTRYGMHPCTSGLSINGRRMTDILVFLSEVMQQHTPAGIHPISEALIRIIYHCAL